MQAIKTSNDTLGDTQIVDTIYSIIGVGIGPVGSMIFLTMHTPRYETLSKYVSVCWKLVFLSQKNGHIL